MTPPKASPFGIVPTRAVYDLQLSAPCLRVLMALATYADEHRICYPSQRTIAERLGVTRQAIGKHIEELTALGYLERVRRFRADGGQTSNEYRIVFDQHAKPDTDAIPLQHQVAPLQRTVAPPATPEVAPPCKPVVAPPATSGVAPLTDQDNRPLRNRPSEKENAATPPTKVKAPRPRDELWDTLIGACGMDTSKMTQSERGKANRALAELREINAKPEDILARVVEMRAQWESHMITPQSVAGNWSKFDPSNAKSTPTRQPAPLNRQAAGPPLPNIITGPQPYSDAGPRKPPDFLKHIHPKPQTERTQHNGNSTTTPHVAEA